MIVIAEYGKSRTKNSSIDIFIESYKIYGIVFDDENGNGELDANEKVLPGWKMDLVRSKDNYTKESTTDDNGYYEFSDLDPNIYALKGLSQTEWNPTVPSEGPHKVKLINKNVEMNFGNWKMKYFISGYVFNDPDRDMIRSPSEPGISRWTVKLEKPDGSSESIQTNENGYYNFGNLTPGIYRVCEDLQDGWKKTVPDNECYSINLTEKNKKDYYNFGNWQETYSISGYVFGDLDKDEVKDHNEPGLSNWMIRLERADNSFRKSTQTDEGGFYSFYDLPADKYRVHEELQTGWKETTPRNEYYSISLPDNVNEICNFGNRQKVYSISGFVFEDRDQDGTRDPNEPSLSKWMIRLEKPDGSSESTQTNENGLYNFENLKPEKYRVREDIKEGWKQISPTSEYSVHLVDKNEENLDFGNLQKVYTISGKIFNDINGDGIKDIHDIGLEDKDVLEVVLIKPNRTSDVALNYNNGSYSFDNLPSGEYKICTKNLGSSWVLTSNECNLINLNDNTYHINFGYHELPCDIKLNHNALTMKWKASAIRPYKDYPLYYKFLINGAPEGDWTTRSETQTSYMSNYNITVCVIDSALKDHQMDNTRTCNCKSNSNPE